MAPIEFIARALISEGDKILLAHRIGEPNTFLPGGHIEQGEYGRDALQRELSEELGVESVIDDFVGMLEHKFTDRHGTSYEEVNLIFAASIGSSEIASAEGHLEFRWVRVEELAANTLLPSSLPELLKEWIRTGEPFHHVQR